MSASKETDKIAVFKGREVRRVLIDGKWWFSVVDVISVLTDSDNPRDYWYKMKVREQGEADVHLSTVEINRSRRQKEGNRLRGYGRNISHYSIHPIFKSGAIQAVAGAGW